VSHANPTPTANALRQTKRSHGKSAATRKFKGFEKESLFSSAE
jgi:hypothetical protein